MLCTLYKERREEEEASLGLEGGNGGQGWGDVMK